MGQPVRPGQLLLELARHPQQLHRGSGIGVFQSRRRVRTQPARLAAQTRREPDHPVAVRFRTALAHRRRRQSARRRMDGVVRDPDAERIPDGSYPEHQQHQPARSRPASERGAGSRDTDGRQHHGSPQGQSGRQSVPEPVGLHASAAGNDRRRSALLRRRVFAVAQLDRHGPEQGRSWAVPPGAVRLDVIKCSTTRGIRRWQLGVGNTNSARHAQATTATRQVTGRLASELKLKFKVTVRSE